MMNKISCCGENRIAGGPVGVLMGGSSSASFTEIDFRELEEESASFSSLLRKESFRAMLSVEEEPYCVASSAALPQVGL
jgi:hypothetical protein